DGFVNAKICCVVADGHQIGNLIAYAVPIAKLQVFGSRDDTGFPSLSAVSRHHIRTASPGCPDHTGVHGADSNQQLRSAAVLRGEFGLMNLPIFLRKADSCGGSNQENNQRTFQHRSPPWAEIRDRRMLHRGASPVSDLGQSLMCGERQKRPTCCKIPITLIDRGRPILTLQPLHREFPTPDFSRAWIRRAAWAESRSSPGRPP